MTTCYSYGSIEVGRSHAISYTTASSLLVEPRSVAFPSYRKRDRLLDGTTRAAQNTLEITYGAGHVMVKKIKNVYFPCFDRDRLYGMNMIHYDLFLNKV